MMRLDVLASHARFARHALPVLNAMPEDRRGKMYLEAEELKATVAVEFVPQHTGALDENTVIGSVIEDTDPILVADAARDLPDALATGRPVVLMEHGVGQCYEGQRFGGDGDRAKVALYLAPGPYAAEWFRGKFPGVPVVEIGIPAMDHLHAAANAWANAVINGIVTTSDDAWRTFGENTARHDARQDHGPTVAVSFRFNHRTRWPETGSALRHFIGALPDLAKRYKVLGHGHPRAMKRLHGLWTSRGVEVVQTFEEVLARADLFVADNTSAIFEFASTGRPVLCLNAPEYRREVGSGLRFWSDVPGIQCHSPETLLTAVAQALADPPEAARIRRYALQRAYGPLDGNAGLRASEAILGGVL